MTPQLPLIVGSVCSFLLAAGFLVLCLHPKAFHINRR
jgi:hypothetical protein